jgi:hypothetical protein
MTASCSRVKPAMTKDHNIKKCENQKKDKKIPVTFENKWGITSILRNLLFKITRVRVLSLSLSLTLFH